MANQATSRIFLLIIISFIILCVSYIIFIPVFEAPDEPGHFLYAFYISKYNRIPEPYNETITTKQYIIKNIDETPSRMFYTDEKYMFYKIPKKTSSGDYAWGYRDQRHHPPLYYLISSLIIKPYDVEDIDIEDNFNKEYGSYNRFFNNKILINKNPTIFLVLVLRLFQAIYGVLIIFFVFKIIQLISNNKFEKKSILLLAGLAFLPQFIISCARI